MRVSCSTVFEKITPPASWHLYRYKTVQLCLIGPNYCSMVATNLRFLQIVSVEFDHCRGRARASTQIKAEAYVDLVDLIRHAKRTVHFSRRGKIHSCKLLELNIRSITQ